MYTYLSLMYDYIIHVVLYYCLLRNVKYGISLNIIITGLKLLRGPSSVTLSDLLTLYRAVLRAHSIATLLPAFTNSDQTRTKNESADQSSGKSDESGATIGAKAAGIEKIHQELQQSVSKCDKFLALIEEIVDLQRIQETYGARHTNTSSSTSTHFDTTSGDGSSSDTYAAVHGLEHSGGGEIFRDKWVRVRPSFTPELTALHRELQSIANLMHAEHQRVVELCSELADKPPTKKARTSSITTATSSINNAAQSKVIMLEHTEVHGTHFRVTKRLSNSVLKILNGSSGTAASTGAKTSKPNATGLFGGKSVASGGDNKKDVIVLSNQKAGTLFVTPQVSVCCVCIC